MRDPLAVRVLGVEVVLLRIHHMILGPGDAAQHGSRGQLLGVQPHPLHHLLHDALLIVLVEDGKAAREPLAANL